MVARKAHNLSDRFNSGDRFQFQSVLAHDGRQVSKASHEEGLIPSGRASFIAA